MTYHRPHSSVVDPPAGGLLSTMPYYAYVIQNRARGKIYIGHTADLDKRLQRHNGVLKNKVTSFTSKNAGLWGLVHSEEFSSRGEAIRREKELKSFRGREFIKKIIK